MPTLSVGIAAPNGCAIMTYTIPHYPTHLIDFVSAKGRRVTIRPMLPQDSGLQRQFFRSLSPKVRYSRFMASFNELPDGVAERLGRIDYSSHLALLAEIVEDRTEIMVGEARYVIDEQDSAVCEFAVAVADNWQGCGIGRALLAQLEHEAAASGIRRMVADALYENKAMRGLAVACGYAVTANPRDGRLVKLEKQVGAWMAASPNTQRAAATMRMRHPAS